jgi:branched-chain amino acid transport system permease protein
MGAGMATQLLTILADGILLGVFYASIGLGLSLILGIMGVVNVAHGAFMLLASYFAFELFRRLHIDPTLALLLALPVFFALGNVVYRAIITRVERAAQTQGLVAMFGLMVLIENLTIIVWTTDSRVITASYTNSSVALGPIVVAEVKLITAGTAVLLIAASWWFLHSTIMGRAIRALGQDRDAALTLGIDARRLSATTFGLGIACAGAAGVMIGMIFPFNPSTQVQWLAWSFLVVILGGLGNVAHTLLAGLVVGLIQTFVAAFLPFDCVYLLLYVLLAVILIVRREGLSDAVRRAI